MGIWQTRIIKLTFLVSELVKFWMVKDMYVSIPKAIALKKLRLVVTECIAICLYELTYTYFKSKDKQTVAYWPHGTVV